jgi:hypothetical protein
MATEGESASLASPRPYEAPSEDVIEAIVTGSKLAVFELENPCHASTDGLTPCNWPEDEYRGRPCDIPFGPCTLPMFPPDWPERGILS